MAESFTRPDPDAVEKSLGGLIRALGLDPRLEPELAQTPARVAALYAEIFSGLDPAREPELAMFPAPAGGGGADLVIVRDIPFYSLCIHHFVPFFGRAHIGYLPGDRLVGISGLPRVLEFYTRRPQLQERIAAQVADHLTDALAPRGVAVMLEARHLCMEMRGVRTPGWVETRVLRGVLTAPQWAGILPSPRAAVADPHDPG